LIGSGIEDEGGAALLFRSEDLYDWEYRGPLLAGDLRDTGAVWECPELLQFDTGALLHVSDYSDVVYFTGTYDSAAERFEPDHSGILDHGVFYAPQSFEDEDGRTLMFGWIEEDRDARAQWDAGWSGAMSLPRVVSLTDDGRPEIAFPEELRKLRQDHHSFRDLTVSSSDSDVLDGVEGDTLEVKLTVDAANTGEFGLVLRVSPDREERTVLRCSIRRRELVIDRSESSNSDAADDAPHSMPVKLDEDGRLSLHLFLDRSVLEVLANDTQVITSRIYPTRADSTDVEFYATDREVTIESLDVWELGLNED
jgi:beta-fructofuranosidase